MNGTHGAGGSGGNGSLGYGIGIGPAGPIGRIRLTAEGMVLRLFLMELDGGGLSSIVSGGCVVCCEVASEFMLLAFCAIRIDL